MLSCHFCQVYNLVFFLSLLWRAAESKLRELRQIVIDEPYLTELRRMVRDADPNPLHLFPVELIQISSRGFPHNHTPMPMEKTIPAVDDSGPTQVPHYRFYFDGLIVHFDRRTDRVDLVEKMGPLYVGFSEELHVSTVRFENSFQRRGFESIAVPGTWQGCPLMTHSGHVNWQPDASLPALHSGMTKRSEL